MKCRIGAESLITESEPWAELRCAEGGEAKDAIRARLPRELGRVSELTSFLQHERNLLEGNDHSLGTRKLIPVKQHDRPPLHTFRISKTDFPSFITLITLLERFFCLRMSPKRTS